LNNILSGPTAEVSCAGSAPPSLALRAYEDFTGPELVLSAHETFLR